MTVKRFFRDIKSPNVEAHIYDEQVLMVKDSKEAQEEIYQPRAFIEIRIKGQTDIIIRPLQEKDVERFPDAWKHYQGQEVVGPSGTPISQLDGIEDGMVVALRARGIHFIEDLARIQPEMISGMSLGIRTLQKKAQNMLGITSVEQAAFTAREDTNTLKEENASLKQKVDDLESMLKRLMEHLNEDSSEEEEKPVKRRAKRKSTES